MDIDVIERRVAEMHAFYMEHREVIAWIKRNIPPEVLNPPASSPIITSVGTGDGVTNSEIQSEDDPPQSKEATVLVDTNSTETVDDDIPFPPVASPETGNRQEVVEPRSSDQPPPSEDQTIGEHLDEIERHAEDVRDKTDDEPSRDPV